MYFLTKHIDEFKSLLEQLYVVGLFFLNGELDCLMRSLPLNSQTFISSMKL